MYFRQHLQDMLVPVYIDIYQSKFPSRSGPPTSLDCSHNTRTETLQGTCRTLDQLTARWTSRSCSAAQRKGSGCRVQGTRCRAWAGWFCGGKSTTIIQTCLIENLTLSSGAAVCHNLKVWESWHTCPS